EFAEAIFNICPSLAEKYGAAEQVDLRPCTSDHYKKKANQLATRPRFSVLANMNLDRLPLNFMMPPYFMGLAEYLGEKHSKIFDPSVFGEMFFNTRSKEETDDEEETSG
ncbi:MAG: hypothetical protein ACW97V_19990, partial [Promethearchaeota archaeon]